MRAMRVESPSPIDSHPLKRVDLPIPEPLQNRIRIRVRACAACLTDLHIAEGDLPFRGPVIPGHQAVGMIDAVGHDVKRFSVGEWVGVAWLHETCEVCPYCRRGMENLCEQACFTGYGVDGGYSEYLLAHEDFVYPIPPPGDPVSVTPLLCAGIIGYRAFRLCKAREGDRLGLYGFGSSAHITIQIARHLGCEVYVFTRNPEHRRLARELGAVWAGNAEDEPPQKMNASILFAPSGMLVREALRVLDRGGTLAIAGIHLSTIPELDYRKHLYFERSVQSVANNTRSDGTELLRLANEIPIQTHTRTFRLEEANAVLAQLKRGEIQGTAVFDLREV